MSGIVLSSSVRQNLLSLQSTADLLATTQNRLSTGKKVNTALDNPTNFFTASKLDSRAGDINNLLDGIGNGVQVLQAANTGITSLQKLVDTAKSIANQALQTSVGYSTKSNVSATIAGATATDLRGTTTYSNASAVTNVLYSGNAGGATAATGAATLGATAGSLVASAAVSDNATSSAPSLLRPSFMVRAALALLVSRPRRPRPSRTATSSASTARPSRSRQPLFRPSACSLPARAKSATSLPMEAATPPFTWVTPQRRTRSRLSAISPPLSTLPAAPSTSLRSLPVLLPWAALPAPSSPGVLTLKSSTGADLSLTGKADSLKVLKLTTAVGAGPTTLTAARANSSTSLGNLIADGSTLNVDGHTITFKNANARFAGCGSDRLGCFQQQPGHGRKRQFHGLPAGWNGR